MRYVWHDMECRSHPSSTDDAPPKAVLERSRPRRNLGLLLGLLAFGAVVLALLAFSLEGSFVWSTTTDDLLADSALRGRRVRMEGTLVAGSLMKRDEPCEYRFQLHAKAGPLQVRYPRCVIPDSFADRPGAVVKVTVEGTLGADGVFDATQVLAKCPSKYEDKDVRLAPADGVDFR